MPEFTTYLWRYELFQVQKSQHLAQTAEYLFICLDVSAV